MSEHKTGKPATRRMVLTQIKLTFESGESVNLDPTRVSIVDKETKKPIFNEVFEG